MIRVILWRPTSPGPQKLSGRLSTGSRRGQAAQKRLIYITKGIDRFFEPGTDPADG